MLQLGLGGMDLLNDLLSSIQYRHDILNVVTHKIVTLATTIERLQLGDQAAIRTSSGPCLAGAVLLRAAEPLVGLEAMELRRGRAGRELSNGPAKLCQALQIDLGWNGEDLVKGPLGLWTHRAPTRVAESGRIGIQKGRELPLRFYDPDSRFLSRTRS